jgi:DNA repair exonuclease SbcCD ATPase subunit
MIADIDKRIFNIENLLKTNKEAKVEYEQTIEYNKNYLNNLNQAIEILTAVLSVTQEGVTEFIRDIVATALRYVYDDSYDFHIEFELKRNQPEVVLAPMKDGRIYDPRNSCGIGVVDVCAFALRVALWALIEPRTAPVMILDESFRNVHGKEENERLANMVSKLSEMLGLQIIMVSGESALTYTADKVFNVKLANGISEVEVVK